MTNNKKFIELLNILKMDQNNMKILNILKMDQNNMKILNINPKIKNNFEEDKNHFSFFGKHV